jgi:hypothetical protein
MPNALRAITPDELCKLTDFPSGLECQNASEASTANARAVDCSPQRRPQVSHRLQSSACDDKFYDFFLQLFSHIQRLDQKRKNHEIIFARVHGDKTQRP